MGSGGLISDPTNVSFRIIKLYIVNRPVSHMQGTSLTHLVLGVIIMTLQIINVSCNEHPTGFYLSPVYNYNYSQLFPSSDATLEQKSKTYNIPLKI